MSGKIKDNIIEALKKAAFGKDLSTFDIKNKLHYEKIIDGEEIIINSARLFELLPSEYTLKKDRITENENEKRVIKLRTENWEKVRELWEEVTKRYALEFTKLEEGELEHILSSSLEGDVFATPNVQIKTMTLSQNKEDGKLKIEENSATEYSPIGTLQYGEFLKQLTKRTCIKPLLWHKAIVERHKAVAAKIDKEKFNPQSLENIIAKYEEAFKETFAEKYLYSSLDFTANTSLIKDGKFVSHLPQGLVGVEEAKDVKIDEKTYLYDKAVCDGDIEHNVLKQTFGNILVYGKLPRESIKVPTYTGGTTTPDFIYALKDDNGGLRLYLFVETKSDNLRDKEKITLDAQKKFFEKIGGAKLKIKWKKITDANELSNVIRDL